MQLWENYLTSVRFEFERYKTLGDRTFQQLTEADMHWRLHQTDNSIAIITKHLVGNMRSRWTNFLTEDGEKNWRDREGEFENPPKSKAEIIAYWNSGWTCLFDALDHLNGSNFDTIITIRNENHTIIEALNRQLAHYAGHVGQIILIGKMRTGADWISPSIPKGGTQAFNDKKVNLK
ncbi:DUF1572 family protein [Maribacter chungangensis]|uniref:DUF1572 family protein n=1 Tax=Maribacter chungangensis TaxID=1069117 RepID=A0ABW3B2T8_9FLAO